MAIPQHFALSHGASAYMSSIHFRETVWAMHALDTGTSLRVTPVIHVKCATYDARFAHKAVLGLGRVCHGSARAAKQM
jgi:hypothetical protein